MLKSKRTKQILVLTVFLIMSFALFGILFVKPVCAETEQTQVAIQQYFGQAGYSFYLTDAGEVYAIGVNSFGQLGDGTVSDKERYEARKIELPKITQMAVGGKHVLALDENGSVYAWGGNTYGQLGIGRKDIISEALSERDKLAKFIEGRDSAAPQKVEFPEENIQIQKISASIDNSVALDQNGNVWCWGANAVGQLGNGVKKLNRKAFECVPSKVKNTDGTGVLENISDIQTTNVCAIAVDSNGYVYAWGSNFYGCLANSETDKTSLPVQSMNASGERLQVEKLSAYNNNVLVKDRNGAILMYGNNMFGQRADGTFSETELARVPTEIEYFNDKTVTDILCAGNASFAIAEDGILYAWGLHSKGSLGLGDYADLPDSVKVIQDGVVVTQNQVLFPWNVALKDGEKEYEVKGFAGTCGVRTFVTDTEGTMWGFGDNSFGQAGNLDETFPNCNTPVKTRLNTSNAFDQEFEMPNYMIKPIVTIFVFLFLVILMILALRLKEYKMQKIDMEINAQKRKEKSRGLEDDKKE